MVEVDVLTPWLLTEAGAYEFAVKYDYESPDGWTDVTAQISEDVLDGLDVVVVRGRISEAQLQALQADVRYPVLSVAGSGGELTPEQRETLRSELAEVVHPDVARLATDASANPVEIADALRNAVAAPPFRVDIQVNAGEVYQWQRNLFEVVQSHQTQADWTPNVAKALWKRWYNPDNEPEAWVQPLGAHDAYRQGARVIHAGFVWTSLINANVWEPGSVGAEALWQRGEALEPEEPGIKEWVSGEQNLKIGDLRSYQGVVYRLIQSPGVNIWSPNTVPALWQAVN